MSGVVTIFAIIIGKLSKILIRLAGKSGGTAAPGLIAESIDKNFIANLCRQLEYGSVVISGTNGKTTTSRIISKILTDNKFKLIHNRAGSNLMRGIATTLIGKSNILGKIDTDIGLWEADEATLPIVIDKLKPKIVVLTNLFRDQLDRYGEVDKIKKLWQNALAHLPKTSTLVLNADDPAIAHLGHNLRAKVIYFGIDDPNIGSNILPRHADTKYCSYCSSALEYEAVYISHMGKYACPICKNKRPKLNIVSSDIHLNGTKSLSFNLQFKNKNYPIQTNLAGIYNIYNVIAAVSCVSTLNLSVSSAIRSLKTFKGAFGRLEKVKYFNRNFLIFLVKNPTGFNEVIRTLFSDNQKKNLVIAINDNIADGRDISWLWDVDFEKMQRKINWIIVSGTRSDDMALRLKYANVKNNIDKLPIKKELFDQIVEITEERDMVFILPTYTALLEVNKFLAKKGILKSYWKE